MNLPNVSATDATLAAAVVVVVVQYVLTNVLPKKFSDDVTRFLKAFSGILVLPGVATYAIALATSHQEFLKRYPWVSLASAVVYYAAEAFITLGKKSASTTLVVPTASSSVVQTTPPAEY